MIPLDACLARLPLVAILRGITPEEVVPIGRALVEAGFAVIEVPLNSPRPMESIERLASSLGEDVLIGAGTVTTPAQVGEVSGAGGRIVVMPHADTVVIGAAKSLGLSCLPGIATPTEAFAALSAGADALKLFPAEMLTPPVMKAMLSVLPKGTRLLPVGGITPERMASFREAGAAGFGLGSALYRPGDGVQEVGRQARAFVAAWRGLEGG
ncbi:2-dehydro-3-deoxy-6-phosphogalactonate aldolase [Roseomonas sp. GCM10028921]